jgi:hypothetical protein
MIMPGPTVITPSKTYQAKRRPVRHQCTCGHSEMIVPPCSTKGVMMWRCKCGVEYKLEFAGEGTSCNDNIARGLF